MGLDSTLDLLDQVKGLVADGKIVFEDGKISIKDIMVVPDLIRKVNAIVADAPKALEEMKDIDREELVVVVSKILEIVQSVVPVA